MKNSVLKELTVSQKKQAQGNYLKFTALNAISYGSLGDSVLILYALKLGGSDTMIAILVSFFYLTMPAMLVGKAWVSRLGTTRTFGYAWILRNLSTVFFLIAPLAQRLLAPEAGFIVLGTGVFFFFIFRTIGITPMTTLIGDITSQKDQGHFISRIWFWSSSALLVIIIISARVLGSDPDIRLFQYIFIFGGSVGILSSLFLFKIPSSDR
ncbi:hypothetical protein KAH55_14480 [bacterium]|nr:hypothetical protein [bacterium]